MRAKKVFEKFTEDSDPIEDMGIGLSYYFDIQKEGGVFGEEIHYIEKPGLRKKQLDKYFKYTDYTYSNTVGVVHYYKDRIGACSIGTCTLSKDEDKQQFILNDFKEEIKKINES